MTPFIFHLNYESLVKYFPYNETPEQLHELNPDGFEYLANIYDQQEDIRRITDGFKAISRKYDIMDHYDNLLMLAVTEMDIVEGSTFELKRQNEEQLRTKELAQLLLTFKETAQKDYDSIQFKTRLGSAKVTDKRTTEFILKQVHDGIRDAAYPIGGFDLSLTARFFDYSEKDNVLNLDKVRLEATKPIPSYKRMVKSYQADFCLHLYNYLDGETALRPDKTKLLSDKMLNFYFDLLVLLEFIKPEDVDSEPKDYVGSLVRNRIKHLST